MNARPGLALFDLDLTLLPIDSDHAWGEFVIREGWVDEAAFRAGNDAFYEQYKAGRLDIDAYVAFAAAPLRERSPAQLAEAHARFMRDVIAPAIRPAATALVETHRAADDVGLEPALGQGRDDLDGALVDQRRVDAVHFLGDLDALAGARCGLPGSGLAEQPVDEFLDHWSKSLKMRQPRSRATASSSGDGLTATGSVARSSRGRSLGESL